VRNAAGECHDVVILSQDIGRSAARHRAFGFEE
jgi:hypothetical protein